MFAVDQVNSFRIRVAPGAMERSFGWVFFYKHVITVCDTVPAHISDDDDVFLLQ